MAPPPRLLTAGLFAAFLILGLLDNAYACVTGCHGMHADKSYKEGETYVYGLEGSAVTSVSEAQGEGTLKIKADVELTVKPDCLRQVRLKNVKINGAGVAQEDLEKYALQFNYHHGHVDSDLCGESGDSQASLNLKRAVISLFQASVIQDEGSTMRHETDVLGSCPTYFTFYKEGDIQTVNKERNLNHCSHRENIKHGLFSGIVNSRAATASTPLLDAHQKVEQRFKNGVLDKAVSTETYKLRPFSHGDAAAKTVVEVVLTFKEKKGDVPAAPVSQPKSLIFDSPHLVVKSSADAIKTVLQSIHKDNADNVIKPQEAGKFSELIRILRTSNKKDIISVYNSVKADPRERKLLLDALYRTGTGEAAEVLVDLVKNKEISGSQELLYYASLAFVQHVNSPAVSAVTSLLDQPSLPRIGYLGIGHIIGKYCEQHSCKDNKDVKAALDKIMSKVGNGKTTSRANEDIVLASLKALGNAKYLDDGTIEKLANIAADKGVRNRVRVTVLETLPTKCSSLWESKMMNVFADVDEDSEIRIKAYLALVACPCSKVATKVKEVLDKEPTYQVGSFIQTHLRNLRASVDPFKKAAKGFFSHIKPKTKFPEDFRKYSFNNEFSYDIEGVGLGSSAEGNVIYSQNSFVPRSASLNLTTDVFGHSFNFLELNTRVENLDKLLEYFFGPKGHFTKQDRKGLIMDLAQTLSESAYHINDRLQKTVRGKRDVKQADLDNFAKKVQLRSNEVDPELDVDLSVKLFGVELAFLSYDSANAFSPSQVIDNLFDELDKGIKTLKNLQYDSEHHLHFLDAELIYPTGLGFALNIGTTGSSVVRVKTNSKIDIPAILADPKNAAVQIALEPSASIEVIGDVMVSDGFGSEAGIKVLTTLHTATGWDLNVKMLEGKGIDINLGLPKKKQEIITVASDVLYTSGKPDKLTPLKFGKGKERSDCFDQLSVPLGFTICGHFLYPHENLATMQKRPFYPLNGPFKFHMHILNDDVSSYHFRTFYNKKDPFARKFELLFETPNSKTNRRVAMNIDGTIKPEPKFLISFESPLKKASLEFLLKNNEKEHTAKLTIMNEKNDYYGRVGVESLGASKYKPVLEYKLPTQIDNLLGRAKTGGQKSQLQGVVEVVSDHSDGSKKLKFNDIRMEVNGRKVLGLDGNAAFSSKYVDVDINIGSSDDKMNIKVDGKRKDHLHYNLNVYATPSKNPASAVGFEYKYDYTKPTLESSLALVKGPNFKDENNRITFEHKVVYEPDPNKLEMAIKDTFSAPRLGYLMKAEGKLTKKSLDLDIDVKFDKIKLGGDFSAKLDKKSPGDVDIEFEAEVLNNKIKLLHKRSVIDNTKTKYENLFKLTPGSTYKADALVTYDKSKDKMNAAFEGELSMDNQKMKIDAGVEGGKEKCHSHAKVTANDVKYFDFDVEVNHGANHKGVLSLTVKDYVIAKGQYNCQNKKGSGNLNMEFPKINRKVKATGDMAITGNKHAGSLEILYDAEKDPNKKLKMNTNTEISKDSFDTKNNVEWMDYKTEVNARAKRQPRSAPNSPQIIDADVEITLPNGRYLTGKTHLNEVENANILKRKVTIDLADSVTKGGKTRKLAVDSDVDVVKEKSFSAVESVHFTDTDAKDILVKRTLKYVETPESGKKTFEYDLSVTGSLLKDPIAAAAAVDYDPNMVNVKGAFTHGKDIDVKGSGNVALGNGNKPYTMKGVFEIAKLPENKLLQNLKWESEGSYINHQDDKGVSEYAGSSKLTYNNDRKIIGDFKYKEKGAEDLDDLTKFDYNFNANLKVLDKPNLVISDVYSHDLSGIPKKMKEKYYLKYGDQEISNNMELQWEPNLSHVNFKAQVATPFDIIKKVDIQVDHKRDPSKSRKTDIVLTVNDKKFTQLIEIDMGDATGIHLVFTAPNEKLELLSKIKKLGEKDYSGEYKLITPLGFVTANGKAHLGGADDFEISIDADSDKFKYRKLHVEVNNKPNAAEGRKVFITVTSDGKNLVTGSTNYKKHEEDRKITIEGNGSLQIGEDTKSSSFKYIRKQLTKEADKEVGVAIMLNASFGNSAIVGEIKLSDKEVHVFNSYCEQSKDCAHVKLQSTLDTDHSTHFNHQLQVEVNLKKFNVPVEFGLMTSTKADSAFDHQANLYLHSSKDRTQYTYHVYANKRETAVVITLPSRELALVAFHDIPISKNHGAYKIDISLYLDRKNKPTERTSLLLNGDVSVDDNSLAVSGDAKFTYPSQAKDMTVKGKLNASKGENLLDANIDFDIFDKPSQKISASARVKRSAIPKGYNLTADFDINSKGQQLKVDSKNHFAAGEKAFGFGSFFSYTDKNQKPKSVGLLFSATPNEIVLLANAPDKQLINYHNSMNLVPGNQKFNSELSLFGHKPVVTALEFKDHNSFKYVYHPKGDEKNKITAEGRVLPGKIAEVSADAFKDGNKVPLARFALNLAEGNNFMKPEYSYDHKNVIEVMKRMQERLIERVKELKLVGDALLEEVSVELKDLFDHLGDAQPTLEPLINYYKSELKKLKDELHADQTIKEIKDILDKSFGGVISALLESMKTILESLENLRVELNKVFASLREGIRASYPKLKESIDRIIKAKIAVLDAATKLMTHYFDFAVKLIKTHQKDIEEFAELISKFVQDMAKIFYKFFARMRDDLKVFFDQLVKQVKALPIYEMAQNSYQQVVNYRVPEYIINPIDEFCRDVRTLLPTQELQDFFTTLFNYIIKHVKHEKVDESNEVKKIYSQALNAVRSIISLLHSQATVENVYGLMQSQFPYDLSYFKAMPGLTIVRTSLLKLILGAELPTVFDLYYTYRPKFYPEDSIPPGGKFAYIANGGYIHTFDGKQYILPGNCEYIMAQDMQDGNFSIVANYHAGQLLSITMTERGQSITIKANGNLLANNKPAEYPMSTENLDAYIENPMRNIKSKYGAKISCWLTGQMICYVRVSGYYHGKLRGLFGDANNEPYDDLILPNGKVSQSVSEFANAYKLNPSCGSVNALDKDVARTAICTKYFTDKSTLSSCFNYVDPQVFRTMCDRYVTAKIADGACSIAKAYSMACVAQNAYQYAHVPNDCVSCKVGDKVYQVHEEFTVKLPKKQADIVLIVEQDTANEKVFREMVIPLINELRMELKQNGMTDVEISIIGYGERNKKPRYFTSGNKMNIEGGDFSNMKFDTHDPIITPEEARIAKLERKIAFLKQRLDVEFGTYELMDAFVKSGEHFYRPGAAKAAVAVITRPCEKSPFGALSLQAHRMLWGYVFTREMGLTYYHISPMKDLLVSGKPQKSVVGFDKNSAFTVNDNKKKPLEGSAEMRSNLLLTSHDVCVTFAEKTGGAAFSSKNFMDAKPAQRKQFLTVTARKIAEDLAAKEFGETCECEVVYGFTTRPTCYIDSRADKRPKPKA